MIEEAETLKNNMQQPFRDFSTNNDLKLDGNQDANTLSPSEIAAPSAPLRSILTPEFASY